MVGCTGRCLVVKRPGVLSKVQMQNLVLGVGVFSLLPKTTRHENEEIDVKKGGFEAGQQKMQPLNRPKYPLIRDILAI